MGNNAETALLRAKIDQLDAAHRDAMAQAIPDDVLASTYHRLYALIEGGGPNAVLAYCVQTPGLGLFTAVSVLRALADEIARRGEREAESDGA